MTASRTMCSFEAPRAPGDAGCLSATGERARGHTQLKCEHKTSKKTLGSRDTHKTETRTCTQYHADPCAFCAPVCPCVRPGSLRPVPVYSKAWRVHTVYRYSRPRGAVDSGPAAVLAAVESVAVSAVAWSCGCVVWFGWMVVRFVRVIRVPACARVSRAPVCPVCVPGSRLPPVSFYRYVCPGSPTAPPGVFLPVRMCPGSPVSFYRYCTLPVL